MTTRFYLLIGALLSCLAVILGAFGAHALKAIISIEMMAVYKTAVHYQMFHALALLVLGVLMHVFVENPLQFKRFKLAGNFFIIGVTLFCGSLYSLAFTNIKVLGMITPLGGVCLILGWLFLIAGIWANTPQSPK
ncbi:MAG: uncharacterized membrane protein YgdD (TMEM256/DUF423 family) [Oceanospirillaceae bacterium]|jgi:uncharacterized membrane protein YgdD (TMEM256/DUF423 family)